MVRWGEFVTFVTLIRFVRFGQVGKVGKVRSGMVRCVKSDQVRGGA